MSTETDKSSDQRDNLSDLVRWTHYHCPSWGERCIVLQTRRKLLGFLVGTHKVLLEDGYVGWCHKGDIGKIPPLTISGRKGKSEVIKEDPKRVNRRNRLNKRRAFSRKLKRLVRPSKVQIDMAAVIIGSSILGTILAFLMLWAWGLAGCP